MSYHQYPGCQTCKNARKGMTREHNFFSSKGPVNKRHRRSACVRGILKFVASLLEISSITKSGFQFLKSKASKFETEFVHLSVIINFLPVNYSGKHTLATQKGTRKDK